MAFTEDTTKLLLLANVALGTYSLEGQQPAPTLPPQAAFALNTARPTVQPVIPSPSGWGMNSAYRGFTPINPRPHPRTLPHLPPRQLTRPLLQPLLTPTPAPPVPIRKQRVRKSQKIKRSRTTGFDKKTGEGMLTDVCGIRTPEIIQPVPGGSGEGDYCCPRCHGQFTRSRTVKDHFITCVRKYGNPAGLKWFDDRTLAANKIWHLNHLAKAREGRNVGGDEETVGQEEDGDLEGVNEDQSRDYNISA